MNQHTKVQLAADAIKKKLLGKKLSYKEIYAVMDEIAHNRLGPVLTTYFAAAGVTSGFSHDELYSLTKAMVETGPVLHFRGVVADKHSVGGVAGTRTTMIVVPIVAAAGFKIPKTSSRAITSPSGTADTMEVLCPVTFSPEQIEALVYEVGGCIVWGGNLGLAPADDVLIEVEEPLAFESYDKTVVAIMAKKIAVGCTHLVVDIPYGPGMKIAHIHDAESIARKFMYLAKRFDIVVTPDIHETIVNAGRGIGPVLETRDVLGVLEQHPERSLGLEQRSLRLAGKLLDLCIAGSNKYEGKDGKTIAHEMLISGKANQKMHEIIKAQGGNPEIESRTLRPGQYQYEIKAQHHGVVKSVDNKRVTTICRVLGCPKDYKAGMYLHKKIDESVVAGDILCTLYSSNKWCLTEAIETLRHLPIYTVS
jgi:AMP phosphorylase